MSVIVVAYRGFISGQTKDNESDICYICAKHTAPSRKRKTGSLGIRIMCPSGATYLPADYCFSELPLLNSN